METFPQMVKFTDSERKITRLMDEETFSLQKMIHSGAAWKMEGSIGRAAMNALESGACFLPNISHFDYYRNRVPARKELKKGTKGTLENSKRFYSI